MYESQVQETLWTSRGKLKLSSPDFLIHKFWFVGLLAFGFMLPLTSVVVYAKKLKINYTTSGKKKKVK